MVSCAQQITTKQNVLWKFTAKQQKKSKIYNAQWKHMTKNN